MTWCWVVMVSVWTSRRSQTPLEESVVFILILLALPSRLREDTFFELAPASNTRWVTRAIDVWEIRQLMSRIWE